MKSIYYFLMLFSLQTSYCQWFLQNNLLNFANNDISFYYQKGYIAGDYAILVSDDFGETWTVNSFPNEYFYSVKPIDENICFAVGGKWNDTSFVKRTTNGGGSWSDVYSSNNPALQSICFPTEKIGYAAGGYSDITGYILKTTNYGNTWEVIRTSAGIFSSIFFIDSTKGWATQPQNSVAGGSIIWKTIDGGNNWSFNYFDPEYFYSIFFINENIGWIAGVSWNGISGNAKVYKTTDGGSNWFETSSGLGGDSCWDIQFINSQKGWVVGRYGLIYASTDGGANWDLQESETNWLLKSIYMESENTGWIVGYGGGTYLKTTNGGVTFIDEDKLPNKILDFELLQNYPNPFNPTTKINYIIAQRNFVTLKIYDLLGKEVATLVDEEKSAGKYEVEFNGSNMPSGIYLYSLEAGKFSEAKKLILIR